MSDYKSPKSQSLPERPPEARTRLDPQQEQPKPVPEVSRKPRFTFTDFASI
ncbi:hypothetical protein [Tropicimonas marinistellae]|uniref:hypothetical protein n=1 Tax=Tropicimonas marinistellae TaxID=1739787 RepID=UPI001373172C|nr:hypothetical protein [Tropicimonas marinistellae]